VIALTLAEIAAAMSGRLVANGADPDTVIEGDAQTDSREIAAGQIFFARRGEETDGHRYAGQAVQRGAALLVVEHELVEHGDVPQIVVDDATLALAQLVQRLGNL